MARWSIHLRAALFGSNAAAQEGGGRDSFVGPLNIWDTRFIANSAARAEAQRPDLAHPP